MNYKNIWDCLSLSKKALLIMFYMDFTKENRNFYEEDSCIYMNERATQIQDFEIEYSHFVNFSYLLSLKDLGITHLLSMYSAIDSCERL